MPVSKKDLEFMERVAEYFRKTKTTERPKGSIRDTAKAFDLNRNKVRSCKSKEKGYEHPGDCRKYGSFCSYSINVTAI